jgi:hypothetical protein
MAEFKGGCMYTQIELLKSNNNTHDGFTIELIGYRNLSIHLQKKYVFLAIRDLYCKED